MASAMSMKASPVHPPKITTVKALVESTGSSSIPSFYNFTPYLRDEPIADDAEDSVPIIDISILVSGTPEEQSQIIHQLSKACSDWGCYMVINHDVTESLTKAMIASFQEFFDLPEEEKREYQGNHVMDPIRCGTGFNPSMDKANYWRDFLKCFAHPEFHTPNKPAGFRMMMPEEEQIAFRSDSPSFDGIEDYSHQIAEMNGLRNESSFIHIGNIPPAYGRFSQKLSSYNFQSVSEDARYFFDLVRDDSGGHWLKIKKKTHSTGSAYSIHIAWRGLTAFYDAVSESLNSPNLVGSFKRRIEHKVFEFERSPNTLKLVDNSIWIIVPDTEWTGFLNGLIQMLKVQAEMRLAIWFEDIQTEFRGLELHGNHFG